MAPSQIAKDYIALMGKRDYAGIQALFAPNIRFVGPRATLDGASEVATAIQRLGPILAGTHILKMFVDGSEVCVIYDYVTNTDAGAVCTMEWLRIEDEKITSIRLLTDHIRWPQVLAELQRRTR